MSSHAITIISAIIGWAYFFAWSLSFYPQLYLNFKRKSVIGLSFDFLLFNITGYICYSVYNCVLFWVPFVKDEYLHKYGPPIPVQPNDVAFALHALVITILTIIQCFIYDRAGQKNSIYSIVIGIGIWVSIIIVVGLGAGHVVTWLWMINYLSYVKLFITFIKYVPQAWINYKRKSTTGWSIGNVLLDFSGGILSLLQMLLDAVNADNWKVFIGDPVKFGLALFSIAFDILFMIQHYVLYRNAHNKPGYQQIQTPPESFEDISPKSFDEKQT
ncbi:cystinosin [Heterostelium album PN500]|uniref:Cystinosin homolog n=1 Tax=Heterostelium pallidum (strain ATCC 26659 / Pp 5 / PN500) TaxID=670386 RepID=D3AW43_HETP5|nr:cystinosin [Heterostelium album PN500]EFA86516.1 cystinosin [Heterostelium album PN500]|eukprot:XP_020438621.1 cystinosin [Heterostelium album PN500]